MAKSTALSIVMSNSIKSSSVITISSPKINRASSISNMLFTKKACGCWGK